MYKQNLRIKIHMQQPDAVLPQYHSTGSSGLDLCCLENKTLLPLERHLFLFGFSLEIPEGYEVQIRPRSGLALKHGITVLNTPGTVDADYRGEIGALLINMGAEVFHIERGMRIAQMVVAPVQRIVFEAVDGLSDSQRGHKGFGSSGL